MRVLSGIQPSGSLHIGNYFAMMKPMIRYQETSDLFVFIVNYHAQTSVEDPRALARNTIQVAQDWLALGLDPERCTFYTQSDVPEVCELTWILCNVTPVGLLERAHSYKDKVARGLPANHGLFTYPVLMAADILLYQAHVVPVGKDQQQHLEITRDIAFKFNHKFGETFVVPEAEISEDVAVIPGIDGQKMSKSYDNTIDLFGDENEIRQKFMSIVTDSLPVEAPKDPEASVLFALYRPVSTKAEVEALADRFRAGGLRYGDLKVELFEKYWEYFAPFRAKRAEMAKNEDYVRQVLEQGAAKARAVAAPTLKLVRDRTGLNY
ncbi:MAG: tryptophan--tRNA ligase [Proteobacteria bacterium]|nr:tryptophan--tRNA ligase [Pseudomonadota bacterium]MBU1741768.1 tryptophan--tRNA ligase [Pseudomonadota bacterium]